VVGVGLSLYLIGVQPEIRIKIIRATDSLAQEELGSIAKYITEDEDYHRLAPHVIAERPGDWTKHSLSVKRTSKASDPTVQAYGIFSSVTGAHCDVQIWDDVVDEKNSLIEPAKQKKVISVLQNTWLQRLEPEGFVVWLNTRWTEDDALSVFMEDPNFCWLLQSVSDDFKYIESKRIIP
jgi:hypothetical protein